MSYSCFPLAQSGNSWFEFPRPPENFLRLWKIPTCKQLAMSRQSSTTVSSRCRIPMESYIVPAMHPIDMHPRTTRFRARAFIAFVSLQIALCGGIAAAREIAPLPPSQLYGALFQHVQTERIFADSKTFADAVAKSEPGEIVRRYEA